MQRTFFMCTSLTGTIIIDANPSSIYACFARINFEEQNLELIGETTMLERFKKTASN